MSPPVRNKNTVSTNTAPEKAVEKTNRLPPARSQPQASVARSYKVKPKFVKKRVVVESAKCSRHARADDSFVVSKTSDNLGLPSIASLDVRSCSTNSNYPGCSSYSRVSEKPDTNSSTQNTSDSKCNDAAVYPYLNIWDRSTSNPSLTTKARHSDNGTDDVTNFGIVW